MADEKLNEVKATEVKQDVPAAKSWVKSNMSLLTMVVLTLVFLGLLVTAFLVGRHSGNRLDSDDGFRTRRVAMNRGEFGTGTGGMPDAGMRGGMMGGPGMMDSDFKSSSRVMGVVIAVDGDTITVAGNGTTKTIKVTSDTNYTGDDKPAKVNDSIMAVGTASENVLTATSVRLIRQ